MQEPGYEATRGAWRTIWEHADLATELETRRYPRSQQIRQRFLPYLPRDKTILEAGCGLGVEMVSLSEAGFTPVGIDYVVPAVERLKAHAQALRLLAADIHALPFADASIGAYLSFGVLEHFRSGPEPALREAARVLVPGGILVLTVPAPNLVWRLREVRRRWPGSRPAPLTYFETTYSAAALTRLVTAAGFDTMLNEAVGHDFTLWGCGRLFRRPGYYRTSRLAEVLGRLLSFVLPRSTAFATLIVARKAR
jgi:SAM-dependent methyltransferase